MAYGYNPSYNTFTNPSFTNNQYPAMTPPAMARNNGLLWVQGEAGAKSFIVGAGQTVLLLDSEEPVFYIKSADMSGMPTMRAFTYTENTNKTPSKTASMPDLDKYLTKDEFYAEIEKLKGSQPQSDIETVEKVVAKKKKQTVKDEEDDE